MTKRSGNRLKKLNAFERDYIAQNQSPEIRL